MPTVERVRFQIGKDKFHLPHQFDKYNGVAMPTGSQLGVGAVPLPGEDLRPKNSVYPRGNTSESVRSRAPPIPVQVKDPTDRRGSRLISKCSASTPTSKNR